LAGPVASMEETRNAYKLFMGIPKLKRQLPRHGLTRKDTINGSYIKRFYKCERD